MTIRATSRRLEIRPVTSVIGAEIDGLDLRRPLDAETVTAVSEALTTWKVLFFRDQAITFDDQINFARHFGELTPAHPVHTGDTERPEVFVVDTRSVRSQFGHDGEHERFSPPRLTATAWHTDITFVANPALASILHGAVIPPFGGDTMWTNLVAAYEDLSAPIRHLVDGLQAVHKWHRYDRDLKDGYDPANPPAAVHPVVRVHPVTGERALFVNPLFTRYIVGLSDRENRMLLDLLFDQIARPEFTVRFRWETNSVAFWDNRATAHLGPVDLASSDFDRRVARVTLAGDLPVGPDGFESLQLRGEPFASP
jgi:alpha-ketoglutarate-dependent taurine dioxygenase